MKAEEAHEIPDRFIQKRRVIVGHIPSRVGKTHFKKRVRHAAVRFAVHEVAPPAADLADDHTHRGVVEHDQRRDLLHAAQNKHSDRAADDTAVDR